MKQPLYDMRFSILIFSLLGFSFRSSAQCCSANPVAGSVNVGTLTKKTFRTITFYRYNSFSKYYTGFHYSDFDSLKNVNSNFLGSLLAYGISNKITFEAQTGYYINKSEIVNTQPPYTIKGWGLSNGVASVKYNIFKKNEIELAAGVGVKFPFAKEQQSTGGVILPQSVQPCTGALGGVGQLFLSKTWTEKSVRIFLIHRTEINGTNSVKYKTGDFHSTSLFVSKSFNKRWTLLLQSTYENRGRDILNNKTIDASGGYFIFLSPQINYTIAEKWNISALTGIRLYWHYNGTQIGNQGFTVSLTRDFQLGE